MMSISRNELMIFVNDFFLSKQKINFFHFDHTQKMAEYQIVKYKHGKITFEVLTYMGSVLKYRDGKIGNIENVLMSDEVLIHLLQFFNYFILYLLFIDLH